MGVKKLIEEISYELGFDGDITDAVRKEAEKRLLANSFRLSDSVRTVPQGTQSLMDYLRDEIEFQNGNLCKRVCSWCGKTLGYISGSGITHGICDNCYNKEMEAINEPQMA